MSESGIILLDGNLARRDQEFAREKSLEERIQDYYDYQATGWAFKEPPALDPHVELAMTSLGLSDSGKPVWKFIWGGACIIRSEPHAHTGIVRGPEESAHFVTVEGETRSRLKLRFLKGRKAEPQRMYYRRSKKGRRIYVRRESEAPKDVILSWEVDYVDYGTPRWFLMRFLTPEQLIAGAHYRHDDPALPRGGDYVPFMNRTLPDGTVIEDVPVEDNRGRYFMPTLAYVDAIKEHLREEEEDTLPELLAKIREERERREQKAAGRAAEKEWADVVDMVIDSEREGSGRTYSLPAVFDARPVVTRPELVTGGE
jgi:hypothetical protein